MYRGFSAIYKLEGVKGKRDLVDTCMNMNYTVPDE